MISVTCQERGRTGVEFPFLVQLGFFNTQRLSKLSPRWCVVTKRVREVIEHCFELSRMLSLQGRVFLIIG